MLRKNRLFWSVAIVSLVLDRLTKVWVSSTFELHESWPLWPQVFHFTYVTNTGAAFSMFRGHAWLPWLSLLVSAGLVFVGLSKRLSPWDQAGTGFLLGGAAGNGIDRWLTGHVVDFLDFRLINFAVFNIADIAINLGIACLIISMWQGNPPKKRPSSDPASHSSQS